MLLACFSVARLIQAQTFIIASCERALSSVSPTFFSVWYVVPLEGVSKQGLGYPSVPRVSEDVG